MSSSAEPECGARKTEQLPLAHAQVAATLFHHKVKTLRERLDHGAQLHVLERTPHIHIRLLVERVEIVAHGAAAVRERVARHASTHENKVGSWGITEMLLLSRCRSTPDVATPSMNTSPSICLDRRNSTYSSELLPAPEELSIQLAANNNNNNNDNNNNNNNNNSPTCAADDADLFACIDAEADVVEGGMGVRCISHGHVAELECSV